MSRSDLFAAIRPFAPELRFTGGMVTAIDALADSFGMPKMSNAPYLPLTVRGALEIVGHEAIVPEWYLDIKGIGTWSVGITKASGVDVVQYKDNPASIETCISAFLDRLRHIYIPDVLKAFGTKALNEAQFTAALSFHYNTGGILKASWVKDWLAGDIAKAKSEFMSWRLPAEIVPRRQKECNLFFDGKWSGDGTCLVYSVAKPSYRPIRPAIRDISADMAKAMDTQL